MSLGSVTLSTGRAIGLTSLRVERTYAGLIEGYPNARTNAGILRSAQRAATEEFGRWSVHVVKPAVRLMPERDHRLPEPWEELPTYRCIGVFSSSALGESEIDGWPVSSRLVVVWFQDYVPSIFEVEGCADLSAIPWDELATDMGGP